MNELIVGLLAWIHTASGYPAPQAPPVVQRVTHAFIVGTMCDGKDCTVRGLYRQGRTVYLDRDLDLEDNPYHTSILLHELVHYVQAQSGQFPERTCESVVEREREAYSLQRRWLYEHNVVYPARLFVPGPWICSRTALKAEPASGSVPAPTATTE